MGDKHKDELSDFNRMKPLVEKTSTYSLLGGKDDIAHILHLNLTTLNKIVFYGFVMIASILLRERRKE